MEERREDPLVCCFLDVKGSSGHCTEGWEIRKVDTKGTRRRVVGCGNDEDRVFWKAGLVTLCRSIGRLCFVSPVLLLIDMDGFVAADGQMPGVRWEVL